jgi:hypothetical protein
VEVCCQLKSTKWATGVNADPETVTTAGELLALLTNETEPLTAPAACGAKLMVAVVLAPTATVRGNVIPVTLNPAPVTLAADIVTEALPVLLRVTVRVAVSPTATWPKAWLLGVAPSMGFGTGVAAPERITGEI